MKKTCLVTTDHSQGSYFVSGWFRTRQFRNPKCFIHRALLTLTILTFALVGARAQYFDATTQPTIAWNGGDFTWDEACSNLGQFVVAASTTTVRLVGNSASVEASAGSISCSADADYDGDGDWTPDPAVATNHSSNVGIAYVSNSADHLTLYMNVILLNNSTGSAPGDGKISILNNLMSSSLPSPQVQWSLPKDRNGNLLGVENISVAMDPQFMYIAYMVEGSPGWNYYYAVVSLGENPQLVNGPVLIMTPPTNGGGIAVGNARPTVACNRWQYSHDNGVIAFTYQNTGGRFQPAIVYPDDGPGSASNITEPPTPTECLWVRAVDYDNQPGSGNPIPERHYFYAYQNLPTYAGTDLLSTDNAGTVWGPVTTTLQLYSPGGVYVPSPGVGDGYINHNVYCDYVDIETGVQTLRILGQQCTINQLVASGGFFSIFSLGCNQMGTVIPFNNGGAPQMWRGFWPFRTDIAENTLATGLCKVEPNVNLAIQGVGVGTAADLAALRSDTLRIYAESNIAPAQMFQFANINPPGPPPALWAGEHPSNNLDVDPVQARGEIILDNGADVDFGGAEQPPLAGAILQARSDGSIDYNGAIFNNEDADLIGCTGETRSGDESGNTRGFWWMNKPLSFDQSATQGGDVSVTHGIYAGSTFGGVKGQIFFYPESATNVPFLTISGQGSGMNFDSTWVWLWSTNNSQFVDQIWAEDANDGHGPPSNFIFTNGEIINQKDQNNGYFMSGSRFENRPTNPGSAAALQIKGLDNIDITNNIILYTQFNITNPVTTVKFNSNRTENIQNLIDLKWTNPSQFGGQINIDGNTFADDWPFGSGNLSDASQTIIFDGITVPVSDQWMVHCDGNIFYNHSAPDGGTDLYNPNSTAVLIKNGADVDVTDNYIGGYGTAIDNQILTNAYAFYCNNFIFQSDACPPRGIGILEENYPGAVYPKLNTTADLAVGYWAKGTNASTPIANQFGSNNSAFVLISGYPAQFLVTIGPLAQGTEPGTVGAEFSGQAATLLYGSHTGADDYAGFNQMGGNTEAQVKLDDDGSQDAQPVFGLPNSKPFPQPCTGETMNGDYGENVFTAPTNAYQFEANSSTTYQLDYSLTENQWHPTSIANTPSNCWHFNSDAGMHNVSYLDIGDGSATGSFICSASGKYYTKKKDGTPLSVLDNRNPYNPTDTQWLYFEALPWIGINNQFALDTMRMFVERFPSYRPLIPAAFNFTAQIVARMADTGVYIEKQPWIDQYNWAVSIYTNDTESWYHMQVFFAMGNAAQMFSRNLAVNISWNMIRLFPWTYSTDSGIITEIRGYQKEIPEDTTPFYIMQVPPVPYGSNAVTASAPQGISLSAVPNPANGELTAIVNTTFSAPAELELFDDLGNRVQRLPSPRLEMGNNRFNFDCSALPAGNYFLRLAASNTVKTVSVTIQH